MAKKCDICGSEHEEWQSHVFADSEKREAHVEIITKKIKLVQGDYKAYTIPCHCGCGKDVVLRPRYYSPACRVRAKRARDGSSQG